MFIWFFSEVVSIYQPFQYNPPVLTLTILGTLRRPRHMNLHAQRYTQLPPLKTVGFACGGLFFVSKRGGTSAFEYVTFY